MKKKKGFIAVSLIYSFFLVFLMIMLASITKNAQNRQLLRVFKNDLQAYLNDSEFIVTLLPSRTYRVNEVVSFADENWQVIKDNGSSVVLILQRTLNKTEITSALGVAANNTTYFNNSCTDSLCRVRMCTNSYSYNYCSYGNANAYRYYSWENSIAKPIIDYWFEQHEILQRICRYAYDQSAGTRICQRNTLIRMSYSDGSKTYRSYARLATYQEAAANQQWATSSSASWTLTRYTQSAGKSFIYALNRNAYQNADVLTLRPVIEVRKS